METGIEADEKKDSNFSGDSCTNLREKSWDDGEK